ncbi:sulfatase-like hydrolase/transferase [Kribbella shirazensis]|uniref:Arylsulfatase A-like enzyme n=1 Tax=Kribbella shirazensis TaxID=1105143 RepID=A0A7X5VC78_9ACTN|nr:sulfatase-like hydrolase/transferase [Kribbella shirazensis]NIK58483.1 arylsulfatase A-like enzyme [Kribbella shirazensis]
MTLRTVATAGLLSLTTAASTSVAAAGDATVDEPVRPNVITIVADDLGFADTSLYGGTIDTPNIAALARAGVTFTDGYAAAPVCAPSRLGLITGRDPARWGADSNVSARQLPTDLTGPAAPGPTMARALHDVGYSTMAVGKWDLSGITTNDTEATVQNKPNLPHELGFDQYYGILAGIAQYCPENDNETYRWDPAAGRYRSDEPGQYLTDAFSDRAAGFAGDHAGKDDPFFLYLAYNAPHVPLQTRSECSLPPPAADERSRYEEMVRIVDEGVGRVLAALDAADGVVGNSATDANVRNTIVVFTSDNGPEHEWQTGDLRARKYSAFEGGVRVPFAMSWPAMIPPGTRYGEMVSALDLLPTFAAAAGAPLDLSERPGVDLVPPVLGGRPAHTSLQWRYYGDNLKGGAPLGSARLAIRSGDVKYLRDVTPTGESTEYLFDLGRDYDGDGSPDGHTEQHNEVANPQYDESRQRLIHSWQSWATHLPVNEPFEVFRPATGLPDGYTSYGGTWSRAAGAQLQVVTDTPARVMAPATYFRDSTAEADVRLSGAGAAGLVTHGSTGPAGTPGQYRLNGYRTELIAGSDQVQLSRVDDGVARIVARGKLAEPVRSGTTYRLRTVHTGSGIEVSVDGRRTLTWNDREPWAGGSAGLVATADTTFDDFTVKP